MELVAADSGKSARRGANFRGEVRKSGDVVAVKGDSIGELAASDLHTVARVSGETDHSAVNDLALVFRQRNIGGRSHASLQLPYFSVHKVRFPNQPRRAGFAAAGERCQRTKPSLSWRAAAARPTRDPPI